MYTFKKTERLCSKKDIELLYSKGRSKFNHPLKVYWLSNQFDGPFPARLVISVPKRLFKKAHERNRIKRQIREAYRLNKSSFYAELEQIKSRTDVLILYTAKE